MSETLALKDGGLITGLQDLLSGSTPTRTTPETTHRGILGETVEGMQRWLTGDAKNPANMSVITRTRTRLGRWTTSLLDIRLVTPTEFADEHLLPFTRGAAVVVQGALEQLSLYDDRTGGREIPLAKSTQDALFAKFTLAAAVIAANPLPDETPHDLNLAALKAQREELLRLRAEEAAGLLPIEERLHAA